MNTFWEKANACLHLNLSDKILTFKCWTPGCHGVETYCQDCKVYITRCQCGANNGLSGWSYKRWKAFGKEKMKELWKNS